MEPDSSTSPDKISAEVASLRKAFEEEIGSIRDSVEGQRKAQNEIPIHLAALRINEDEKREARTYRKNNYRAQVSMAIASGIAAVGACVYAAIASHQLTEMRQATQAATGAAYAACLGAQLSRQQILQNRENEIIAQNAAIAAEAQAFVATQAEAAYVLVAPNPKLTHIVSLGQNLAVPVILVNRGKAAAKQIKLVARAEYVPHAGDLEDIETGWSTQEADWFAGDSTWPPENQPPNNSWYQGVNAKDAKGNPIIATQQIVSDYNSGKSALLLYGHLTYVDVFGTHHWRDFCVAVEFLFPGTPNKTWLHPKCYAYSREDNNLMAKPPEPIPMAAVNLPR